MAEAEKSSRWMKFLEIAAMPVVIAAIGLISSWWITDTQLKSAEKIADAQNASTLERHNTQIRVKLVEIFRNQILVGDEEKRKIAISLIERLDPQLYRAILYSVSSGKGAISTSLNIKPETVIERIKPLMLRLVVDLQSSNKKIRRGARDELTQIYVNGPTSKRDRLAILDAFAELISNDNSYRQNFGILYALSNIPKEKWVFSAALAAKLKQLASFSGIKSGVLRKAYQRVLALHPKPTQ
jgi:hypothetical protein